MAAITLVLSACSSGDPAATDAASVPSPANPSRSPASAGTLDALFEPVRGFRFDPIPPARSRDLDALLRKTFGGLRDVRIVVLRVATTDGGFVPVRVAAISYELPPGATFEQLAYEVGREFLGSTPQNSEGILGGNGVYMHEPGETSESVAFFLSENVFVYAYGATVEAPTEIVSRRLYEVACSRIECDE